MWTQYMHNYIQSPYADPLRLIIPIKGTDRNVMHGQMKHTKRVARTACSYSRFGSNITFSIQHCEEHKINELVPMCNAWDDFRPWYTAGLHPRFSILEILLKEKQRYWEIKRLIGGSTIHSILKSLSSRKLRTRAAFIRALRPHLFTWIRPQGRHLRVPWAFAKKFTSESFTVQDFIAEQNQELRRLMLRRGVEIDQVLSHMKLTAKDQEGALYEVNGDTERYLHVVCPSTQAQYLLRVPRGTWDSNIGKFRTFTPSQARRWTFRLEANAEFAKEA